MKKRSSKKRLRSKAERARALKRGKIDQETQSVGCGPVDLNVAMARKIGWSEVQIQRVWDRMYLWSRRETRIAAYRKGKTLVCPTCEQYAREVVDELCELCRSEIVAGKAADEKHRAMGDCSFALCGICHPADAQS